MRATRRRCSRPTPTTRCCTSRRAITASRGRGAGKPAIERFLRIFVASRIQGELRDVAVSGPPWAMTIWVRFDDHADAEDGTRLYENRTVLVLRTRWGRVVDHEDFFTDTERIAAFDRALAEREPELAVVGSARR